MSDTLMALFGPVYMALHSTAGIVVLIALLAAGLYVLNRRPAMNLSQRLMRWRVGLQLAVIVAILGMVLLRPHAPIGGASPTGASVITKPSPAAQ